MTDDPYHARKMPELSDFETDSLSAQVTHDLDRGEGAKHFEDVLDELHSTQARPTNAPTAAESEEIEKLHVALSAQLKRDATHHLLSHGLRVYHVGKSLGNAGFLARIKDRDGREFEAHIGFDEANRPDVDGPALYQLMVDALVERALLARKKYFDRMCLIVEGEDSCD